MNGFINLLKPTGMSSAQAVGFVKKTLGIKKVGHAGTLDPLASGVLPIMLGRATKLFDYMQNHRKEYICEVCFGVETDTLDADGQIVECHKYIPTDTEIDTALDQFIGTIKQIPPKYSALKYQGQRMYDMARTGQDFIVPERETTVYHIKRLRSINKKRVLIYISCKSGFYVRSFCRDLAKALGTNGFMSALIRASVADFNIQDSVSVEELSTHIKNGHTSFVQSMDTPLKELPLIVFGASECSGLRNGLSLPYHASNNLYRIYQEGLFIGLARLSDNVLKMETLLVV